jgi:hypothetical protein
VDGDKGQLCAFDYPNYPAVSFYSDPTRSAGQLSPEWRRSNTAMRQMLLKAERQGRRRRFGWFGLLRIWKAVQDRKLIQT